MFKTREVRHNQPIAQSSLQEDGTQKFLNTVRAMLKMSSLVLDKRYRFYKATLTIPYEDVYGFRTFGCIVGKDFILDYDLIYEELVKLREGESILSKKRYLQSLFMTRTEIPFRHVLSKLRFKRTEDTGQQETHKFVCVPNSVLNMKLSGFLKIID